MSVFDELTLALQLLKDVKALTQADRAETIRKNSPYSQQINSHIHSGKELDLYINLNLEETVITRPCLVMDIDPYYCTPTGETNTERMAMGKPPIDYATGSVIDLHHIGQSYEAPYAELPHSIHDAPGINSTLHSSRAPSWRNNPKLACEHNKEAAKHWKQRGEALCRTYRMFNTTTNSTTCTRPCSNNELSF